MMTQNLGFQEIVDPAIRRWLLGRNKRHASEYHLGPDFCHASI